MNYARLIGSILLVLFVAVIDVEAEDICTYKADPALTHLKTWRDFHNWYTNYPQCDDGDLAEGLSEFVVVSFAKRWNSLSELKIEVGKSRNFRSFVMKHIDASTDENDLKAIVKSAKTRCPSNLRSLCREIEKSARMALEDM